MKPYAGSQSSIGGAGAQPIHQSKNPRIYQTTPEQPLIGSRLSARIIESTGKQPCGTCRKIRDGIDKLHSVVRKMI